MDRLRIRRVTLANWGKWSRIILRTMRQVLPKETWISARIFRSIFLEDDYVAYVATVDDVFAGFAIGFFWKFNDEPEIARIKDPNVFHLCMNIIAPEYQGRGIGRRLIEARIEKAKQRGARTFTSFARNGASLHNFKKLGGRVIGTRENYHDCGETFNIVCLKT